MDDPITSPPASPPSIVAEDLTKLHQKLAAIPPDKKGALIWSVDWKGGVPVWGRFGVATRVGEHLQLSVEAETRFKKAPPNGSLLVAWTW